LLPINYSIGLADEVDMAREYQGSGLIDKLLNNPLMV
jgi:hypothetical protein